MADKEQLHVRIPADLMAELRDYATDHGFTLATAVNVLLHRALNPER